MAIVPPAIVLLWDILYHHELPLNLRLLYRLSEKDVDKAREKEFEGARAEPELRSEQPRLM